MDAYSEVDCIYFSLGDKTSYAKYVPKLISDLDEVGQQKIETGTYQGAPPYKTVKRPLPKLLKQYHAAEHKVYNGFMNKIAKLSKHSSLETLSEQLPNLEEAKAASSFSIFCGSTVFISSGILLLATVIPYIFNLNNNPYFIIAWLAFIILLTIFASYQIQNKFYLAKANDKQLLLAIEALKEVLKNE